VDFFFEIRCEETYLVMMVSKRQKKIARVPDLKLIAPVPDLKLIAPVPDFDLVETICILSEGEKSLFDGLFGLSIVSVCRALHKLVKSGHLKLKGVVLAFPVPTGTGIYKNKMSQMQVAYENHKKDYTEAYTLVGVRATQPEQRKMKPLFHDVVCKVLEAHAGTIEMLSLTLTMPPNREVFRTFLKIVSSCTNVTDLDMDVQGLIGHDLCTVDLAFEVEAVVKNMQKMKNLSWTGFFKRTNSEVLVKQLPPSVESLRLTGNISPAMGTKIGYAMMFHFLVNGLPNLENVDLTGYVEQDNSLSLNAHLLSRLCDFNSVVKRVILPAEWTPQFKASIFVAVGALCLHADRLARTRGERLTIVISNTDAMTRVAHVQYLRGLVCQRRTTNVVVE
jgi:hypothetical protein